MSARTVGGDSLFHVLILVPGFVRSTSRRCSSRAVVSSLSIIHRYNVHTTITEESSNMSQQSPQLPAINTAPGGSLSSAARINPSPSTSQPRSTHSASHIRKRSVDASEIMSNSPTARRMSQSTTPQDATQQDEGVVTRALRQAEMVVAGLCATALL